MGQRWTLPWVLLVVAAISATFLAGAVPEHDVGPGAPAPSSLSTATAVVGDLDADQRDLVAWALERFRRR